ncbi:MAG: hypothetical protein ABL933_18380 [Methyloglobulus sp.]|nr:hypothetical protein [Methyloglobulus sp.]
MAEENNSFWQRETLERAADRYALSGTDPPALFADANTWGPVIALTTYFAQGALTIGQCAVCFMASTMRRTTLRYCALRRVFLCAVRGHRILH